MGSLLEGYQVATSGPLDAQRAEEGRQSDMRTAQLDQLQKMQELDAGKAKAEVFKRDRPVREEERATKIMEARRQRTQAKQDIEARSELDAVSRLEMAYKTNNQTMYDATIAEMGPDAQQLMDGLKPEEVPMMIKLMRNQATRNLEQSRALDQIGAKGRAAGGVERIKGQETRATQREGQTFAGTQGAADRASAERIAETRGGLHGAIGRKEGYDPGGAREDRDAYIGAGIRAEGLKGQRVPTQAELNKEVDRAVSTGMTSSMQSLVTTYSGHGLPSIKEVEKWQRVPGWAAMTSKANQLVRDKGFSGSDVHDYMTQNFIMINKEQGFVRMPTDDGTVNGNPVGERNAEDLLREARITGDSLEEVVRKYGIYIQSLGYNWNPTR